MHKEVDMRILCATDLLPRSEAAIERAGMLAARLGGDLSLLHVVAPSQSQGALEAELQRASTHLKARVRAPMWRHGVTANVMVRTGTPSQRVIESIADVKADLIVLGPHRKRGLSDALGGTIAEKILRAGDAAMLVVQREPRHAYRNVLLAVDLSPVSARAIQAAESFALLPEARAAIVHAYEPPYEGMLAYAGIAPAAVGDYTAGWSRQAERAIRAFLARHSRDSKRYSVLLEEARPATAVLRAAARIRPDLLVMGTHGRGRVGRALIGSVANTVLRDAQCDVLIVPAGSSRSSETTRDERGSGRKEYGHPDRDRPERTRCA
jgi:universal stress protein E